MGSLVSSAGLVGDQSTVETFNNEIEFSSLTRDFAFPSVQFLLTLDSGAGIETASVMTLSGVTSRIAEFAAAGDSQRDLMIGQNADFASAACDLGESVDWKVDVGFNSDVKTFKSLTISPSQLDEGRGASVYKTDITVAIQLNLITGTTPDLG